MRFLKGLCFLTLSFITAIQVNGQDSYPVPPKTEKLLFYFQRSHNRNTIIYEVNTLANGEINIHAPTKTYWIRYEEGGVIKELSFFQRMAFELEWQVDDKNKECFILHFRQLEKRKIYLLKNNSNGKYKAYISINGELAQFTSLYVNSINNSFGFPLKVIYIEISGINTKSGKVVKERYIPEE